MPERLERNISYDRLTTPTEHLGVLIEPEADRLVELIGRDNSAGLESVRILDTTVGELRRQIRARLELAGPVILTGHQVEFTHAGVFAKTIAAAVLARRFGEAGVFLAVDSDLPKQTGLRMPTVDGELVRQVVAPVPGCDPSLPVESQSPVSASLWQRFFSRLADHADDNSLLACFATTIEGKPEIDQAELIENGQAAVGRELGLEDLHTLQMSRLSQMPEFRTFVAHLMLNAHEVVRQYNRAQRDFRIRRRVRNPQRPAPLLFCDADQIEVPFWIGRTGQTRRRLFVGDNGDRVELFADRESISILDKKLLSQAQTHCQPWQVELDGWHLRPRALTLSAFARLFISDLFIHGIGGAKYDEMTEDFIRSFLGTGLPPACCVSATAYLSLPRHGIDCQTVTQARHVFRDLRFNPQRHFDSLPLDLLARRSDLIASSRALRGQSHSEAAQRRRVFNEIRSINNDLLVRAGEQIEVITRRARYLSQLYNSDCVASDREYFFALHSRETLTKLVQIIQAKFDQP